MVWLVLTILVGAAIAFPFFLKKKSPQPNPWFEERRRIRDERVRVFRPKKTRWWERLLGVVVVLGFCVVSPVVVSVELAVEVGAHPVYGAVAFAALVFVWEVLFYFAIPEWNDRRFVRLQADRSGFTQAGFHAHFACFDVRPEVAHEVRDHLQVRWAGVPDFVVLPSDGLYDVYRMDVLEEIDDILEDCLCREPTREDWVETPRLETVEDLVLLVDRLYVGSAPSRLLA